MTDTDDLREWSFAVGNSRFALRVLRWSRAIVRAVLFPFYRLQSEGTEHLDIEGPLLIAPVHRSNLDSILIASCSHRRIRALAKESLFRLRPFAWYISALGAFPLQRGTADREAMRAARSVLDRREALLVFPEGTRQSGPEVNELFDGTVWLAARAGAPIVAVGVAGTEESMPAGRRFPRRTRVAIVAAAPIMAPEGRVSRARLGELTGELRSRLQEANNRAHELAGAG